MGGFMIPLPRSSFFDFSDIKTKMQPPRSIPCEAVSFSGPRSCEILCLSAPAERGCSSTRIQGSDKPGGECAGAVIKAGVHRPREVSGLLKWRYDRFQR